jgi:hypothetical protein
VPRTNSIHQSDALTTTQRRGRLLLAPHRPGSIARHPPVRLSEAQGHKWYGLSALTSPDSIYLVSSHTPTLCFHTSSIAYALMVYSQQKQELLTLALSHSYSSLRRTTHQVKHRHQHRPSVLLPVPPPRPATARPRPLPTCYPYPCPPLSPGIVYLSAPQCDTRMQHVVIL